MNVLVRLLWFVLPALATTAALLAFIPSKKIANAPSHNKAYTVILTEEALQRHVSRHFPVKDNGSSTFRTNRFSADIEFHSPDVRIDPEDDSLLIRLQAKISLSPPAYRLTPTNEGALTLPLTVRSHLRYDRTFARFYLADTKIEKSSLNRIGSGAHQIIRQMAEKNVTRQLEAQGFHDILEHFPELMRSPQLPLVQAITVEDGAFKILFSTGPAL